MDMTCSVCSSDALLSNVDTRQEDAEVEQSRRLLDAFAYMTDAEIKCAIKEYSSVLEAEEEKKEDRDHLKIVSSGSAQRGGTLSDVGRESDEGAVVEVGVQQLEEQRNCERGLYEEEITQLVKERLRVEQQTDSLLQLLSLAVADAVTKGSGRRQRPPCSPEKARGGRESDYVKSRRGSGKRREHRDSTARSSEAERQRRGEVYVSSLPQRLRFDEPLVRLV
ncbi:hypothetical protein GUITHDRAFT_118005 [Guillardia theta CCMP2712]|uniref:Uncharacterized protein n=1 Tax=Guillardia theta (strain CCMP2712) TaxID=905079 RepID=L1IHY7_GUITC|nr:hypothetical protein GUITHDRAFT_118005 [Guillardia theta CCMP2712]EKX35858.1 hypothetical protein GUITHDRAFT_118005 [Guillardia theta CCMP2712]|eukprot:XP_005822838.1 hypothetical protein GUITHDRAFT_118005 [Guillardia theta CCMP2712]